MVSAWPRSGLGDKSEAVWKRDDVGAGGGGGGQEQIMSV